MTYEEKIQQLNIEIAAKELEFSQTPALWFTVYGRIRQNPQSIYIGQQIKLLRTERETLIRERTYGK